MLSESRAVLRTRPGTIIVDTAWDSSAPTPGIDHSNVAGQGARPEIGCCCYPKTPTLSAARLRSKLEAATGPLGVLIIDSHGRAWRMGTVGVAIGAVRLPGLVDLRGEPTCSASACRSPRSAQPTSWRPQPPDDGAGCRRAHPLVHVRGFPYPLRRKLPVRAAPTPDQDLSR